MFTHTFKVSLTAASVVLVAALSACATPDAASTAQPNRGPTDCQLVQQAMNRASQAQQDAINKDQESKAQAQADQELYEADPKKYWREKREDAIARGMDPEQARSLYNVDRGAPINLGRYSDSQAAGNRAYSESFTIAAAGVWPRVEDPDLKSALRELSQGTSQRANFDAITSICRM